MSMGMKVPSDHPSDVEQWCQNHLYQDIVADPHDVLCSFLDLQDRLEMLQEIHP